MQPGSHPPSRLRRDTGLASLCMQYKTFKQSLTLHVEVRTLHLTEVKQCILTSLATEECRELPNSLNY